jgi:hypothetical protein
VSFTQDDYSAAVKKLLEFARVDVVDPRLGELFGGQAAEWEMPIVNAYLLYGHRAEDGRRLVDRFLATRGRLLSTGVAAALRALHVARAALLEIEAVQVGSGFDATDVERRPKTKTARISADRFRFLVEPWGIEPQTSRVRLLSGSRVSTA